LLEDDLELLEVLSSIETLLRRVEAYDHANILNNVIAELKTDETRTASRLRGTTFWGGSGSLRDLILTDRRGRIDGALARDNLEYRKLLQKLLEVMARLGYAGGWRLWLIRRDLASDVEYWNSRI